MSIFVSFSTNDAPDVYLRHQLGRIKLSKYEDSTLFRQDATFKIIETASRSNIFIFESTNIPRNYISLDKEGKSTLILTFVENVVTEKIDRTYFFRFSQRWQKKTIFLFNQNNSNKLFYRNPFPMFKKCGLICHAFKTVNHTDAIFNLKKTYEINDKSLKAHFDRWCALKVEIRFLVLHWTFSWMRSRKILPPGAGFSPFGKEKRKCVETNFTSKFSLIIGNFSNRFQVKSMDKCVFRNSFYWIFEKNINQNKGLSRWRLRKTKETNADRLKNSIPSCQKIIFDEKSQKTSSIEEWKISVEPFSSYPRRKIDEKTFSIYHRDKIENGTKSHVVFTLSSYKSSRFFK